MVTTWGQGRDRERSTSAEPLERLDWVRNPTMEKAKNSPMKENKWTFYLEGRRKIWRAWEGRWSFGEWSDFAIKMYLTLGLQKLASEKMSKRPARSEERAWLLWINSSPNEWVKPCKTEGRREENQEVFKVNLSMNESREKIWTEHLQAELS